MVANCSLLFFKLKTLHHYKLWDFWIRLYSVLDQEDRNCKWWTIELKAKNLEFLSSNFSFSKLTPPPHFSNFFVILQTRKSSKLLIEWRKMKKKNEERKISAFKDNVQHFFIYVCTHLLMFLHEIWGLFAIS